MLDRNEILAFLSTHGTVIGADASSGNKEAKEVMHYYSMWHRCPSDPGAETLVEQAMMKWLKQRKFR